MAEGEDPQQDSCPGHRERDLQLCKEQHGDHQHIHQRAILKEVSKDGKDESDRIHRQLWRSPGIVHGLQLCQLGRDSVSLFYLCVSFFQKELEIYSYNEGLVFEQQ